MTQRKKIFAISGSTRKHSTNQSILNFIERTWGNVFDISLYEGLAELPHFNPDLDNEHAPSAVLDFRARIAASDGVIICTPEYVFSLPGALKNALEWTISTTLLSDKPMAMIVASGLGEKTFESLSLILQTVGAKTTDQSKVLISGARAKFDAEGKPTDDEAGRKIETALNAIQKMIQESAD